MAFLGVVLLALCFAEEVVELEPVKSGNYDCNYTTSQPDCNAIPYCYWLAATGKCLDDPCLLVLPDSATASDCTDKFVEENVVRCQMHTVAINRDCAGGSGRFCRKKDPDGSNYNAQYDSDYCFWANLRDGGSNCPVTLCEYTNRKKCQAPSSSISQCTLLNTRDECGLVPKCFWNTSSGGSCLVDPCWATGPITGSNTCEGLNIGGTVTNPIRDICRLFQPWIGGQQENYCVHKDNKTPNICYFGTPGATTTYDGDTDWQNTYPTYDSSTSDIPSCTGTIGTGCEGSGECTTIINAKGAFSGKYCTDGTHGNAGASILYIPSLLLVLALSFMLAL